MNSLTTRTSCVWLVALAAACEASPRRTTSQSLTAVAETASMTSPRTISRALRRLWAVHDPRRPCGGPGVGRPALERWRHPSDQEAAVRQSLFVPLRREAPCRIPGAAGRNSKGGSWVQWLTRIRKVNGTIARQKSDGQVQVLGLRRLRDPRDMAKAGFA